MSKTTAKERLKQRAYYKNTGLNETYTSHQNKASFPPREY